MVVFVRHLFRSFAPAGVAGLTVLAVACAHAPAPAEPSSLGTPPRPTIVCPAPVTSQTFNGQPVPVTFPQPQAAGGVLPLSFACSPPSGARFPIGLTTVACTVTDALMDAFTCSFTVRVLGPPRLSATNFMAFGDSITAGNAFDTYPARLQGKFRQRYQTQSTVVINEGKDGERAAPAGEIRLPAALTTHRPQGLLLIEGSNDLSAGTAAGNRALDALINMVRLAKGRGVLVFLATIPPQRTGGARDAAARLVPAFNDGVRGIAQREGVTLVDLYAAMVGDPSLIGPDDLHPTDRGHEVMAQLFFDVITKQLELPLE